MIWCAFDLGGGGGGGEEGVGEGRGFRVFGGV